MFMPEHHIPIPIENPMTMPQGVDSSGEVLQLKLWPATSEHGAVTYLEAEGDQGPIRHDRAISCRMYQALAAGGMQSVFRAVGIDAQSYPTQGRPTVTTYTTEFPQSSLYIERANKLARPNGPQGADRLTFVPFHGSFDPLEQVRHLVKRELLIDVDSSHDVDVHSGGVLPLVNSIEMTSEIFPYVDALWTSYERADAAGRAAIYIKIVDFADSFDHCFRTSNFADLVVNPQSTEVEITFKQFFSWKSPKEIPRLIVAARVAIANFQQPE